MSEGDARLEALFGGESDEAFGRAVFRTTISPGAHLEVLARDTYRDFTGKLRDRFGAEAWRSTWSQLASRSSPAAGSVLQRLRALTDPASRTAADMLIGARPDAQAAQTALVEAFDRDGICELRIYAIGDGAAMSSPIIAARTDKNFEATRLVYLMDWSPGRLGGRARRGCGAVQDSLPRRNRRSDPGTRCLATSRSGALDFKPISTPVNRRLHQGFLECAEGRARGSGCWRLRRRE